MGNINGATVEVCRLHREFEFHDVAKPVLAQFNITMIDLLSRGQRRQLRQARREVMRGLHDRGWGYPAIADRLCRSSSTVFAAVRIS